MSAYKPRGGALGWGGDEQLAVPRTPRHNRHHSTSHPGHQRMVRYDQGRHREDRRQVSTHYIRIFYPVISISILQLSTLNCSRQEAGPGGGAAGGNLTCFTGPGYELATISSRRPLTSFSGKIIEEQSLVQLLEFLQTSSSTFESSMEISTLFNPSVFGL